MRLSWPTRLYWAEILPVGAVHPFRVQMRAQSAAAVRREVTRRYDNADVSLDLVHVTRASA